MKNAENKALVNSSNWFIIEEGTKDDTGICLTGSW